MCLCKCMPSACKYPQRPEELIRDRGARVTGRCEAPEVGAGSSVVN